MTGADFQEVGGDNAGFAGTKGETIPLVGHVDFVYYRRNVPLVNCVPPCVARAATDRDEIDCLRRAWLGAPGPCRLRERGAGLVILPGANRRPASTLDRVNDSKLHSDFILWRRLN